MITGNLFIGIPDSNAEEIFETLASGKNLKLERIISSGQITPEGEWYDQETNEWVILLSGSAKLLFDGEELETVLLPGDYIFIPAHKKHRVTWTDKRQKTVWLALHFSE
jgi:cupin 2 domain-containing protein